MNTQQYNMHTIRLNDNNRVYLQESNEYVFCDYLSVSTFKYVYSTSPAHAHIPEHIRQRKENETTDEEKCSVFKQ